MAQLRMVKDDTVRTVDTVDTRAMRLGDVAVPRQQAPWLDVEGLLVDLVPIDRRLVGHKREESRLRESLRWLTTIARCIGEGIVTVNRTGTMTYLNEQAECLTGWPQEEAVGSHLSQLFKSQQQTETDVWTLISRVLVDRAIVPLEEFVIKRPDHTICRIAGTMAPVVSEGGVMLGAVCAFREAPGTHPCLSISPSPTPAAEEFQGGLCLHGVITLCAWCRRVPNPGGEWSDLETHLTEQTAVVFNGGICPDCLVQCFSADPYVRS